MLTVLGMVAQMERRFILERQREGIEQARKRGAFKGGKKRLDRSEILSLHASGLTVSAIAEVVSRCVV